jgi:hypothetical protein
VNLAPLCKVTTMFIMKFGFVPGGADSIGRSNGVSISKPMIGYGICLKKEFGVIAIRKNSRKSLILHQLRPRFYEVQ